MAGLKSFLYGVAPILGMTGAALYERQRALVALDILQASPGRGPGSGVPLTRYNIAAVLIAVMAADGLAEVDERVKWLIGASPNSGRLNIAEWRQAGHPTFCDAVGDVLAGDIPWPGRNTRRVHTIRVTRWWRGQLVSSPSGAQPSNYFVNGMSPYGQPVTPIQITTEIEEEVLDRLRAFTMGALSQLEGEEDDE